MTVIRPGYIFRTHLHIPRAPRAHLLSCPTGADASAAPITSLRGADYDRAAPVPRLGSREPVARATGWW
eukprot:scaffold22040_cov152-Isochrysis_galbana.AAC.1